MSDAPPYLFVCLKGCFVNLEDNKKLIKKNHTEPKHLNISDYF